MSRNERLVLLTRTTVLVGGRLLKNLEGGALRCVCLARRPEYLRPRVGPGTEIVRGDVLDPASLATALQGVDVAFYLIHSMGSPGAVPGGGPPRGASRAAARAAGVRAIIYLGGLADDHEELSPAPQEPARGRGHPRSSGVQVLEFRVSIILGSGSLSFEMIRALVERLPIMITPRWVTVPAQPIAIQDVLSYLLTALDHPVSSHRTYEIGGLSRVSYGDLMREYACRAGRRSILRSPS